MDRLGFESLSFVRDPLSHSRGICVFFPSFLLFPWIVRALSEEMSDLSPDQFGTYGHSPPKQSQLFLPRAADDTMAPLLFGLMVNILRRIFSMTQVS